MFHSAPFLCKRAKEFLGHSRESFELFDWVPATHVFIFDECMVGVATSFIDRQNLHDTVCRFVQKTDWRFQNRNPEHSGLHGGFRFRNHLFRCHSGLLPEVFLPHSNNCCKKSFYLTISLGDRIKLIKIKLKNYVYRQCTISRRNSSNKN